MSSDDRASDGAPDEFAAVGAPTSWDGAVPTCTVSLTWAAFESFSETEWTETPRYKLVLAGR